VSLDHQDVRIIKGMLKRGDKQQWIVAWFGGEQNSGRIADINTGKTWPEVQPAPPEQLPPPGPYMGARSAARALQTLEALRELVDGAIHDIRKWEGLSNGE